MPKLLVRDLMTDRVVSVRPQDSLADAQEAMDVLVVRHLPVVDEGDNLLGLVSQRDLLRHSVADQVDMPLNMQEEMRAKTFVRDIMIDEPESVEPDQNLIEAAELMLEMKYGCLPVTEGRVLVGILTEADFVRYYADRK